MSFRTEPLPVRSSVLDDQGHYRSAARIGGMHPQREKQSAALVVENARRYLAGEPLTQLVDRVRGY